MDSQLAPSTVLVVDDNRDTVDLTAAILKHHGFRALSAYDADTAIKAASVFCPQASLLDLGMPGCDGYQLVHILRQLPGMEHTLFICISGYGSDQDRERSLAEGFAYHLVKPVEWEEMLHLLGRA